MFEETSLMVKEGTVESLVNVLVLSMREHFVVLSVIFTVNFPDSPLSGFKSVKLGLSSLFSRLVASVVRAPLYHSKE